MTDIAEEIKRLADLVEASPERPFSDAEMASLRRVAVFVGRLDSLGWWGQRLLWILAGTAALAINWDRVKGFLGAGS